MKFIVAVYAVVTVGMFSFAALKHDSRQTFISSNGYVLEAPAKHK